MNRVLKSMTVGVLSLIKQVYFKATGETAVIFFEIQGLTTPVGMLVDVPLDTLTPSVHVALLALPEDESYILK